MISASHEVNRKMWCAICKKDVAAEILGGDEPRCSYCGITISSGLSARPRTRTQKARDLLEKWSQPQPAGASSVAASSVAVPSAGASPNSEKRIDDATSNTNHPKPTGKETTGQDTTRSLQKAKSDAVTEELVTSNLPVYRFDRPHHNQGLTEMEANPEEDQSKDQSPSKIEVEHPFREEAPPPAKLQRHDLQLHNAHLEVPEPHFRIPTETEFPAETAESSVTLLAGYMLSYLGILGLLTGTVLVVIGYFKGPLNYMPMGWIVNALGQLLLYLGIVTLVTSKMDRMKSNLISEFHYVRQQLRTHRSSAAGQSESSNDAFDTTDKAA